MKNKLFLFALMIFFSGLINGCTHSDDIEYAQRNLTKPDYIEVIKNGDESIVCELDSKKYMAIYEAVNQNWWKVASETEEIVNDKSLEEVENIKELKTKSDMRYVTDEQIFINFVYDEQSLAWNRSTGEKIEIVQLAFILPKSAEENKNVKGYFAATVSRDSISSEGIYSYYYSDELYNVISDDGKTVTSVYNDQVSEIDLSFFTDVTIEKMESVILETYAWTRMTEHTVYWNNALNRVVINYIFSEKASEEEMNSARDYWKTVELFRNYQQSDIEVNALWKRIPDDADVVIQVYKEDEMMSQDIYGEIEGGIIYKEIHYVAE